MSDLVLPSSIINPRRSCSYCYTPMEKVLNCGSCSARVYCSKVCQKSDWKQHKIWCGCGVAQIDVDYEVRPSSVAEGSGLGVFALRAFAVGDKVLTERAVMKLMSDPFIRCQGLRDFTALYNALPEAVQKAVCDLHPSHPHDAEDTLLSRGVGPGSLQYKYNHFAMGDTPSSFGGLCVIASRFNHACVPNCGRHFLSDHDLLVIHVDAPVAIGEELTISYTAKEHTQGIEHFKRYMMKGWKFECSCRVCKDPVLFDKLCHVNKHDDMINELGSSGREKEAYALGEETMRLYEELGCGAHLKRRTLYDMFQMAVLHRSTLPKAVECARETLENVEIAFGGSKMDPRVITTAKQNSICPEVHKLYCLKG